MGLHYLSHAAKSYCVYNQEININVWIICFSQMLMIKINLWVKSTFTTQHVSVNCNACEIVNCLMLYKKRSAVNNELAIGWCP